MSLSPSRLSSLRRKLEVIYADTCAEEHLARDPLGLIDSRLAPLDFEILSFVAAGLSYGRVEQIQKSFRALLLRLKLLGLGENGEALHAFLLESDERDLLAKLRPAMKGWVHRLNTSQDIEKLFLVLSRALKQHSSLAHVFLHSLVPDAEMSLIRFAQTLSELSPRATSRTPKTQWKGTGPEWFFASPSDGSSCKRLLMWLRWMCRQDSVDPGTWRHIIPEEFARYELHKNYLFWPVDTHILQWALSEGLVQRKTSSWAFAKELSLIARDLSPDDPIKYDFAICHSGMLKFRANRTAKYLRSQKKRE